PTGTIVRTPGTRNTSSFVPEAPTFPAPKTPIAVPFSRFGNHAEFQATPTVKQLPASPNSAEQPSSSQYVVARPTRYVGIAVNSNSRIITFRPPYRSAQMPKFSRGSEPAS